LAALLPAVLILLPAVAIADAYSDARAELVAAWEAEDYALMRSAAASALEARPGYAGALFNLALAEALSGHAQASLAVLEMLLAQQVDFGADEMREFEGLHRLHGWAGYVKAVQRLYEPVGEATIAWRWQDGDFVPEGFAIDPAGGAWLGSIRQGTIVHLGDEPRIVARPGPHWSVYGMRLHQARLWFVSTATAQFVPQHGATADGTGLFTFDPETGAIERQVLLPPTRSEQMLGDLEFGKHGEIYLADQAGGGLYRFEPRTRSLDVLIAPGRLASPQGMALDSGGGHLYVADYVAGLFRVGLADGTVTPVPAPQDTNLYGIDGLYRYRDSLIAIQNGVQPNRVVQLQLEEDGSSVAASRILAMNLPEFDEPNLGQVDGDRFLFIANSHWNRFDREGNLPAGLSGPVVLEIALSAF
jgi:sugar lactone lactonase YvrE